MGIRIGCRLSVIVVIDARKPSVLLVLPKESLIFLSEFNKINRKNILLKSYLNRYEYLLLN